ncbi:MAG: hypothetical protein NTW96_21460 [Planctomycetia bacterium]|nr:hypothetical protein [Planctomycetia bacterium]
MKRALLGAALALGALYPLRTDGTRDAPAVEELHDMIQALQANTFAEISRLRERCEDGC